MSTSGVDPTKLPDTGKEIQDVLEQHKAMLDLVVDDMSTDINAGVMEASKCAYLLKDAEEKLSEIEQTFNFMLRKYSSEKALRSDTNLQSTLMMAQHKYKKGIQTRLWKFKEHVSANSTDTCPQQNLKTTNTRPASLPELKLGTFDGNSSDWPSFWDAFGPIDSRRDLTDSTKLRYLKNCLKGDANERIKEIATTDANYSLAIALLKKCYANPDKITWDLTRKLMGLQPQGQSHRDLQRFVAAVNSCLLSLKGQQVDTDAMGQIIVPHLFDKLPRKQREQVQSHCRSNYPKLPEFLEALDEIMSNMSSYEENKIAAKPTGPTQHNNFSKSSFNKPVVNKSDVGTFHTAVASGKSKPKSFKPCMFCKQDHNATKCDKYHSVERRRTRAEELGRCSRCLSKDHSLAECGVTLKNCYLCEGQHHTFMCVKPQTGSRQPSQAQVCHSTSSNSSYAILTSIFNILIPHCVKIRGMFDQGAQRTFISRSVVDSLQLKPCGKEKMTISGFIQSKSIKEYDLVELTILCKQNEVVKITAVVCDHIPETINMPKVGQLCEQLKSKRIDLADPNLHGDSVTDIKLLIGLDHYFDFIEPCHRVNGVNLVDSKMGKLIGGPIPSAEERSESAVSLVTVARIAVSQSLAPYLDLEDHSNLEAVDQKIMDSFELDSIGMIDHKLSPEEVLAVEDFDKSIRYHNGKYEASLPWKPSHPTLPSNYGLAMGRLKSTVSKLSKTEGHLQLYDKIIKEQLDMGFVEQVKSPRVNQGSHYLPHMAVVKQSATTPIRIVYDCSAKSSSQSPSLNDCLLTGPSLTEDLVDVILRFRVNPYAYVADISKAFLRIGLGEKDRDKTRFLWISNPSDPDSSIDTYRFRSVLFGATCSPFLLQACLRHHFKHHAEAEVRESLSSKFYVDNVQGTVVKESELRTVFCQLSDTMNKAGMPLQEWASNSPAVNKDFQLKGVGHKEPGEPIKMLGLLWDYNYDQFNFKPFSFSSDEKFTKRKVFSEVSKVFDPLGFLTPVTIRGKLLVQEIWSTHLKWDTQIPEELAKSWQTLRMDLLRLLEIKVPRQLCDTVGPYTLHVFTDASGKAYGCVAYLVHSSGSRLVMSKSRVSPLSVKRSIPQLELCGIYIGVKLILYVRKTLNDVNITSTYLWSDSCVSLYWVRNNASKEVFVRNRVNEIRQVKDVTFYHVPGEDNPADAVSRGVTVKSFMKSNWSTGPSWLTDEQRWPSQPEDLVDVTVNVIHQEEVTTTPLIDVTRYSRLSKLLRIVSLVLQFIDNMRKSAQGKPTVKVIPSVSIPLLIKQVQGQHFLPELTYLKERKGKIPEKVKSLNLFIEDGLLRCKGRLSNTDLPPLTKCPIILPSKDPFVRLLIEDRHRKVLHAGVQDTLCKVREEFWILRGRQSVKKVLGQCYMCKRLEGVHYATPPPPDLPSFRVDSKMTPFETTGVDLTGNILLTNGANEALDKYYVVLFTCAVTRAVHLEVVDNLTAQSFLNSFRRFTARRGLPKLVLSDNATNFSLSSKILKDYMEDELVSQFLDSNNLSWRFIPPRSPWYGGFWERLVGVVKSSLKKCLFKKKVTSDDLITIVTEIENRVNNRPLTYVGDGLDALDPLTPSHLLHGRRLSSLPSIPASAEDLDPSFHGQKSLESQFKDCTRVISKFTDIWKKEYLLSLREYSRKNKPDSAYKDVVKLNDIVLIGEETPRSLWHLGKVIELFRGNDGIVRTVRVKTTVGESLRPISRLYPLEVNLDGEEEADNDEVVTDPPGCNNEQSQPNEMENVRRPSRRTALNSRKILRHLINEGDL